VYRFSVTFKCLQNENSAFKLIPLCDDLSCPGAPSILSDMSGGIAKLIRQAGDVVCLDVGAHRFKMSLALLGALSRVAGGT
jgi:hypothetical protein